MQIFQVQPWPKGVGNSEVSHYVKVEAADELDAAQRILQMPLQREIRHDMFIRAFVRRLGARPQGFSTKIYARDQGRHMPTVKVYQYEYTDAANGNPARAKRMGTKEYIEKYAHGWIVEGAETEVDASKVDAQGKTEIGFKPPG